MLFVFGAFARGLGRLAAAEVVNNYANVAAVDAALPLRSCGTDALNIWKTIMHVSTSCDYKKGKVISINVRQMKTEMLSYYSDTYTSPRSVNKWVWRGRGSVRHYYK